MLIITSLLGFFYLIILCRLFYGLGQLKKGGNCVQPFVSLVVAARNEEERIERCLDSLISQNYPKGKYEIIIIDDRSTDQTASIINRYQVANPQIKLVKIKELISGIAPKKHAIDTGIQSAQGEFIMLTDADCIAPPGWLSSMVSYFQADVGLVAGFSPLDNAAMPSIFTKLIRLDSLSLAAVAAGSFGTDFPLTCNARNLAYRKSVYQQLGGFGNTAQLISGDDDLFLQLVRDKTDWKMRYNIDSDIKILSEAPSNFKQFFNQRIRHASKGRYYPIGFKAGLIAVYFFNVLLIVSLILPLAENQNYFLAWLFIFCLKSLAEFCLIFRMAAIFSIKRYLWIFPVAAILHIPYVVFFGLLGAIGKFSWKGEQFVAKGVLKVS